MAQQNPPDIALVLIVDDDAEVLELIADVVQTLGYHALTARSGPDAIDLLRKNPQVAVLFTDIRMPAWEASNLPRLRWRYDQIFGWSSRRDTEVLPETQHLSRSHIEPLT